MLHAREGNLPVHLNRDSRSELLQAVLGQNPLELPWEKGKEKGSFSFFSREISLFQKLSQSQCIAP